MSKKLLLVFVLLLSIMVVAFGCDKAEPGGTPSGEGSNGTGGDTGTPIKIGVMVPTTGPEAYYGKDMMNAYQLAVDEINAAGGVLGRQLELFQEDDGCDPQMANTAGSKIVSNNPDFVIGGYCSGATIPALQLFYDANKVMLVSAANSTKITDLGLEQTFMINSPGTHQVSVAIDLCKSLDVTKVAVIHQGDDYTQNLSDISDAQMPGAGIAIVTTQIMEKGAADVSAIVTAIRQADADMVFWCGYHADGSNVIKQLRQGGYTGYIMCGDGSSSTDLIVGSGPAGDGAYVLSPPYVEFVEGGADFTAAFEAKFSTQPGAYATLCYDTIYVLKSGIETAGGLDTAAVRDAIQNIEYDGLSGLIKFADNRELLISNFIVLMIDFSNNPEGEYVLVEL